MSSPFDHPFAAEIRVDPTAFLAASESSTDADAPEDPAVVDADAPDGAAPVDAANPSEKGDPPAGDDSVAVPSSEGDEGVARGIATLSLGRGRAGRRRSGVVEARRRPLRDL